MLMLYTEGVVGAQGSARGKKLFIWTEGRSGGGGGEKEEGMRKKEL